MTSGTFTQYPIDKITVDRANRQRKDLGDLSDLLESIPRIGLINPIVIERDGTLRAGERRLTACRQLGWTAISVQFVDDLDESHLQLLELDENIKRRAITWQEECDAIERYHNLRKGLDPFWTATQTAEALGQSLSAITEKLAVKEEMKNPESLIHKATKFSEARNTANRLASRRATAILDKIDPPPARTVPLLNVDFLDFQKTYTGDKFNFIHCDFPYGINYDKHPGMGTDRTSLGEVYEDSPEIYWNLIAGLHSAMSNIVAESAHLMFWYSMKYHEETKRALTSMGWKVDDFPLVWFKSDNSGILPDPQRGPRRVYETAFMASRGDRKIVQPVANTIASPSTKEIHPTEKPTAVLTHFFRMFVDDTTSIFDPTAGSANAIRAATKATARLGLERDVNFFNMAKEAFYE